MMGGDQRKEEKGLISMITNNGATLREIHVPAAVFTSLSIVEAMALSCRSLTQLNLCGARTWILVEELKKQQAATNTNDNSTSSGDDEKAKEMDSEAEELKAKRKKDKEMADLAIVAPPHIRQRWDDALLKLMINNPDIIRVSLGESDWLTNHGVRNLLHTGMCMTISNART
jgi:hypothetical protein